jgi:ABC-type Fe3+-siderophore transport system permease subunit
MSYILLSSLLLLLLLVLLMDAIARSLYSPSQIYLCTSITCLYLFAYIYIYIYIKKEKYIEREGDMCMYARVAQTA